MLTATMTSNRIESILIYKFGGTRSGEEIHLHCPYGDCIEKEKQHCWVHVKKGVFHCFRCDAKGSLGKLLKKLGVNTSGVAKPQVVSPVEKSITKPIEVPKEFRELSRDYGDVSSSVSFRTVYNYVLSRGLTLDHMVRYRLMWATEGRYAFRLILPCYEGGKLVYFTARSVVKSEEKRYINPPSSEFGVGKRAVVFNIDHKYDTCMIAEGTINAMLLGPNCVATLGKGYTPEQLFKILAKDFKSFIIAFDHDALGDAFKLAIKLQSMGHPVRVVRFPEGRDAADLDEAIRQTLVDEAIERAENFEHELIRYKLRKSRVQSRLSR